MEQQTSESANTFSGPLFVVGLPRSGTKLLRNLLNHHSKINITGCETGFIPDWYTNWDKYGDLSNKSNFENFYKNVQHLSYFKYGEKDGWLIKPEIWFDMCKSYDITGVFEALMRHDAELDINSTNIWGDKTPQYTNQIRLLHKLWPDARFIHIIRDVRDYCLSMNKAWGKNMYRSAQIWTDNIIFARNAAQSFPKQFTEISYEDLTENTENCLKNVCNFLDINFEENMLHLSAPTERMGDAKNVVGVMKNNKNKFITKMKPDTRNKIESIALPVLETSNYSYEYDGEPIRISNNRMFLYKILDGLFLIKSKYKNGGLKDIGIRIKQHPPDKID